MGVADAPAGAGDAALARVDDGSDDEREPCSAASLALVLHRSGGVVAAAEALTSSADDCGGGGVGGVGVETDAQASLRALLRSAAPGLERATPAAVLSALAGLLQRCSASNAAAPPRGVAASELSHALTLLSGGPDGAPGGGGALPPALLRLLSPSAANFSGARPLGRGGFGTVLAAVGTWDGRPVALKRVPFRSPLPPWAPPGALAAAHAPLLREARALAALSHAHVARYHAAWVEPRWERLAAALATHVGAADAAAAGDMQPASPQRGRGRAQRTVLRIRDAAATSSEEEASPSSDDDDSWSSSAASASASGWSSRSGASLLALPPPADVEGLSGDSSEGGDASFMTSSSASASASLALARPAPAAAALPLKWPYCLYISMELVPGPTLQRWLLARADDARCRAVDAAAAAAGALSPPAAAQARALAAQLAHGLAHLHGRGVLHRDIKPANIILAPGPPRRRKSNGDDDAAPPLRAVIVDLGLAAFAPGGGAEAEAEAADAATQAVPSPDGDFGPIGSRSSASAASTGHTGGVGTATYAAPEQAAGRGYGPPADVYSLGLVILELLCRFGTGMERAQALAAARAGALPVAALEAAAPGAAALVAAMLAQEPARRPTAAAVARSPALRRAAPEAATAGGDVAALRAALAAKEAELSRLRAALERATVAA